MNPTLRSLLRPAPIAWLLVLALTAIVLSVAIPADAATGRGITTLTGTIPGETFGCSVASAGDVNGDSYADVIVGAYQSGAAGVPLVEADLHTLDRPFAGAAAEGEGGVGHRVQVAAAGVGLERDAAAEEVAAEAAED